MAPDTADTDPRVLALLKAHGAHATSFQILEPGYEYHFDAEVDGLIAWVRAGRYRVVAGVPITAPVHVGAVAARFVAEAVAAGDRVLFFSADDAFLAALPIPYDPIPIGEQPEWQPGARDLDTSEHATLRAQVNRAKNRGVTVRTVPADDLEHRPGFRAEVESVLREWLDARKLSAMRFLVDLKPFHHAAERRYYVAEFEGRAVGFLAAIPVYARRGWFFEDLIRVPDAPNGTIELLVETAMADARANGDAWVTLGLAPLASIGTEPGPHHTLRRALAWCHDHLGALYSFDGLRRFKQRFRPHAWSPQYLVQCPPGLGVGAFHAVLKAFAGGGLVAFGLDTIRRQAARISPAVRAAAVWTIAALLVPWTALLAAADGARWFGDESIQLAWVVFDASMVLALTLLGRLIHRQSPRARPVALILGGATATDFVVTTVQALNLHTAVTGWTSLFVLAGMLGPLFATCLLALLAWSEPR